MVKFDYSSSVEDRLVSITAPKSTTDFIRFTSQSESNRLFSPKLCKSPDHIAESYRYQQFSSIDEP